ncbi:MAG: response regulator [Thermodesulfobacteriota bacterium]
MADHALGWQQLQAILDGITEVIYVSDPDSHEILYANRTVTEHFGAVLGQKCYAALQGLEAPCPFCTNHLILGANTGRVHIWEHRNQRRQRWYRCIDRAIPWTCGRMVRAEMAVDITDSKLVEEKLRRYEQIVSLSRELMAFMDRDYVYQAVNDTYLTALGKKRNEIIGHSWPEVFDPVVFAQEIQPGLERCLAGEEVHCDFWYTFPAIGRQHLEATYYPFFAGGAVVGIVVNARDITDWEMLERQLRQAQKMEAIGTLAGGIAHDFNNILGAIIGCTELALLDTPAGSLVHRHLEEVHKASQRAKTLVRQILTFSRRTEQMRLPIRVTPLVEEVLAMLRASLPSFIEIRQHLDTQEDTVLADPSQICQLVMNLGSNAGHAMRQHGGVLTVGLIHVPAEAAELPPQLPASRTGYLRLSVADTGEGIHCEHLDRIFEPYFTSKEQGDGTGLGLAIVHGIVKACDGWIKVQSTPGQGSLFEVLLPLAADAETGKGELADLRQLPEGRERLLVVDDEEALVWSLMQALGRLGYQVVGTTSSLEALELLGDQASGFDLVITDQAMPDLTGVELARRLLAARPGTRIILCTGFSELVSLEKACAMGIAAFLVKPVDTPYLARTIRQVLDHGLDPDHR